MNHTYSRPNLGLIIALACTACTAAPLVARADSLYDFSVYASGAATTTSVTTHGRVAIAGAPTFTNMVIGDQLTNSLGTRYDLIAGGALTYNSGTVNNGNVLYGAALSVNGWTTAPTNNGAAISAAYDFTPLTIAAANASNTFGGLSTTGSLSVIGNATLLLTGTNSAQDVFHLTAAQFDAANGISIINVTPGERIIVNVDGPGHTRTNTVITNAGTSGNTFFNFNSSASLFFTSVNFPGTVLAPNATITLTGNATNRSTIEGSLWANTITATDYTIGNAIAVPLPSAASMTALLLAGMGVIGVARCRRVAWLKNGCHA